MARCYGCMEETNQPVCPKCGWVDTERNLPHQLQVGTVLREQYEVGRVLGQGGYGITYLGWDHSLNIKVAIKEFYPSAQVERDCRDSNEVRVSDPEQEEGYAQSRDKFLGEARALAKFQKVPQIVGIQSGFRENNTAYIIMEYVQGVELKRYVKLRGGRVAPEETLKLLEPMIQALAAVHKSGLIHRDISPDNIMLHPMDGAKLLDFGAVRDVRGTEQETEAVLKRGFAPLEQYRPDGNQGPWTDEYALGATIYYCITGSVPPEAPQRAKGAAFSWKKIKGLTAGQRRALEKAMALKAADRFPGLEEFHDALYAPRKKSPLPLVLGGLAAALALAAGLLLWKPELLGRSQPPAETILATEVPQTLPTEPETTLPLQTEPETTAAPETEPETTVPPETQPRQPQPWDNNVLMAKPFDNLYIKKDTIKSITFLDSLETMDKTMAKDASAAGDGSVMIWNSGTNIYVAAEGGINGRDCCVNLFSGCLALESVRFQGAFHTELAQSMEGMFSGCPVLRSLDLASLDTSSAVNMHRMFADCPKLEAADLTGWNTAAVEDMSELFRSCSALTSVVSGGLDTGSVTTMRGIFRDCASLTELDVSGWNMENVRDLAGAFQNTGLLTLDVSAWNTGNVTTMKELFRDGDIQELDVSRWDLSQVTDLSFAFADCKKLRALDVENWNVSQVTNLNSVFLNCEDLHKMQVAKWDVSQVRDMQSAFSGCSMLAKWEGGGWNTAAVTNMSYLFDRCKGLKQLDLTGWDTSSVTNMRYMFQGCENLESALVDGWDTSAVTDMFYMFSGCKKLRELTITTWDTGSVINNGSFVEESTMVNGVHWTNLFK